MNNWGGGGAALVTMAAQGLAALGGAALAAAIGRIGGPEQLGMFTVMLTLLGVLGMLARRGQGSLLTRAAAWALHTEGSAGALTLLLLAVRRVVVPSLLLGVVGSLLLWSGIFGKPYPGATVVLPVALLMATILALFGAYARGSARPWIAPLFEMGGISLVSVALLVTISEFWKTVSAPAVLSIFLVAMMLLIALGVILTWRDHPSGSDISHPTRGHLEELRRGQIPFTLIAIASFLVQSGSFLLAAPFLSETEVGYLRAAERLALLVSFPVLAINPVIVPSIVRLARRRDWPRLHRVATRAMMLSGGIALPVLIVLVIWPDRALALMGDEFATAGAYLRIMAVAQLAAAVLGPYAIVLNMSGRERQSMWVNVGTLAFALMLIPSFSTFLGALGFAIAYSSVVVLRISLIGMIAVFGKTACRNHYESTVA